MIFFLGVNNTEKQHREVISSTTEEGATTSHQISTSTQGTDRITTPPEITSELHPQWPWLTRIIMAKKQLDGVLPCYGSVICEGGWVITAATCLQSSVPGSDMIELLEPSDVSAN